eukprot:jgi/Mesen1/5978/ME000302S04977
MDQWNAARTASDTSAYGQQQSTQYGQQAQQPLSYDYSASQGSGVAAAASQSAYGSSVASAYGAPSSQQVAQTANPYAGYGQQAATQAPQQTETQQPTYKAASSAGGGVTPQYGGQYGSVYGSTAQVAQQLQGAGGGAATAGGYGQQQQQQQPQQQQQQQSYGGEYGAYSAQSAMARTYGSGAVATPAASTEVKDRGTYSYGQARGAYGQDRQEDATARYQDASRADHVAQQGQGYSAAATLGRAAVAGSSDGARSDYGGRAGGVTADYGAAAAAAAIAAARGAAAVAGSGRGAPATIYGAGSTYGSSGLAPAQQIQQAYGGGVGRGGVSQYGGMMQAQAQAQGQAAYGGGGMAGAGGRGGFGGSYAGYGAGAGQAGQFGGRDYSTVASGGGFQRDLGFGSHRPATRSGPPPGRVYEDRSRDDRSMHRREYDRPREDDRRRDRADVRDKDKDGGRDRAGGRDERGASRDDDRRRDRRDDSGGVRRDERKREVSPSQSKRDHKHSPARDGRKLPYLCKVEPYSLVETSRDYQSVCRRYSKLYVVPEFSRLVACWVGKVVKLDLHQPISFEHDAVDVVVKDPEDAATIASPNSKSSAAALAAASAEKSKAPPVKGSIVWNAKVILMSGADEAAWKELLEDNKPGGDDKDGSKEKDKDKVAHLHNLLKFVVLRKDRGAIQAAGGQWDAALDGGDPAVGDGALLRTAIRCTKESTGIDLSPCANWLRFCEVHYERLTEDGLPSHTEISVMFLPDLHSCLPTLSEWAQTLKARAVAKLEAEAAEKARESEKEKEKERKKKEETDAVAAAAAAATAAAAGASAAATVNAEDSKEEGDGGKREAEAAAGQVEGATDKKEEEKGAEQKQEEPVKAEDASKAGDDVSKDSGDAKAKEAEAEKETEKVSAAVVEVPEPEVTCPGFVVTTKRTKAAKAKEAEAEKETEKVSAAVVEVPEPEVTCPGFVVTTKRTKAAKWKSMTISMDGLLDYDEEDREEGTFELSVFAEVFQELMQSQAGHKILANLEVVRKAGIVRKKEEKKRAREKSEKEKAEEKEKEKATKDKKDNAQDEAPPRKKSKFSDKPEGDDVPAVATPEPEPSKPPSAAPAAPAVATLNDLNELPPTEADGEEEKPDAVAAPKKEQDKEAEDASKVLPAGENGSAPTAAQAGVKEEGGGPAPPAGAAVKEEVPAGDAKEAAKVEPAGGDVEMKDLDGGKESKPVKEEAKAEDVEMKDAAAGGAAASEGGGDAKEEKPMVEAPKVVKRTIVDVELLKAYRYFDRNRTNYLKSEDLKRILHSLGEYLSNKNVKDLVYWANSESGKSRDDRIMYRSFTAKEETMVVATTE